MIVFFTYLFLLLILFILSYLFIDPNQIYFRSLYTGFAFKYGEIMVFVFALLIIAFYSIYTLILKNPLLRLKKIKFTHVLALAVLAIFAFPGMLSFDIFGYITTAKVLYFYHENPYLIMPLTFTGDQYLLFTRFANTTTQYGPLWVLLTGIPYLLGFGSFPLILFNFKLFILLFYFGIIFIINKISKSEQIGFLFALHPLVLVEVLVSSHNDIVMMLFALLSFYFLRNKKILFAVIFFAASVLIKYVTIFLAPVFIYCMIQTIKNRKINWQKVYLVCAGSMLAIFSLGFLREEIYSWYAIWFLPFIFLSQYRWAVMAATALSAGLLLRYLPYMLTGSYEGLTPIINWTILILFIFISLIIIVFRKRLLKNTNHLIYN